MPIAQMNDFTFKHTDQIDQLYNVYDSATVKQKFDSRGLELREFVNGLVGLLNSVLDGSAGADQIGMSPIAETGTSATVQSIIEGLITRIKATTGSASGADLTGATAISGLTGTTVQALLESMKTYIDTKPITKYNSVLASDVAMPSANTWYTGKSVTLPAGTYFVSGGITLTNTSNAWVTFSARLSNGTTHYASGGEYFYPTASTPLSIHLSTIITLGSTTTVSIQAASNVATYSVIKAALQTNTAGATATQISAIKIG